MNKQGKVWGETGLLFRRNDIAVCPIAVAKGAYCSKHRHKSKWNLFCVLSGKLAVHTWPADYELEDVTILGPGESCEVPPGLLHRFEALEDTLGVEIYWTELDLNDIERKDCGGRHGTEADTDDT